MPVASRETCIYFCWVVRFLFLFSFFSPVVSRGQKVSTRTKNKANSKLTCELKEKGEIEARIVELS